jgi:hypothetical protein
MVTTIRTPRKRRIAVSVLALTAVGALCACAPPPPVDTLLPRDDQTTTAPVTTAPPTTAPPTTAPPTTTPPEEPATAAVTWSQLIFNESQSWVTGTVTAPSTGGMRDYLVTFAFPDGAAVTATVKHLESGETGGWTWQGPSDKSGKPSVTALTSAPSDPTAQVNDGFSGHIDSAGNIQGSGPVDCSAGRIDGHIEYPHRVSDEIGVDVITDQGEVGQTWATTYPEWGNTAGWGGSICTRYYIFDPAKVRVLRVWLK